MFSCVVVWITGKHSVRFVGDCETCRYKHKGFFEYFVAVNDR